MSESDGTEKSARRLRVEAALRENLKRRKEQARGRREAPEAPDAPPAREEEEPG